VIVVRSHTADPSSPFVHPAADIGPLRFRGGCIRFEDQAQGPYILFNAAHHCVGIAEVRVYDTGRIEILAADANTGPIVAVHLTADESFSRDGFSVGASGGKGLTVVEFGHRSGGVFDGLTAGLYGPRRNIWCTWWSVAPVS
jgi:hypothetical protein